MTELGLHTGVVALGKPAALRCPRLLAGGGDIVDTDARVHKAAACTDGRRNHPARTPALGVLSARCDALVSRPDEDERTSAQVPIEEKKVLKSGCEIEELRNETAERLKRAIAIYMVIAWRVMLMTLLGREVPDLPAEVLFTDIEVEVLTAYAKSRRDLKPPERLGDAVRLVARLGGYQARKSDPPPGHQVIWIGYSMLRFMGIGYLLGRQSNDDEGAD